VTNKERLPCTKLNEAHQLYARFRDAQYIPINDWLKNLEPAAAAGLAIGAQTEGFHPGKRLARIKVHRFIQSLTSTTNIWIRERVFVIGFVAIETRKVFFHC